MDCEAVKVRSERLRTRTHQTGHSSDTSRYIVRLERREVCSTQILQHISTQNKKSRQYRCTHTHRNNIDCSHDHPPSAENSASVKVRDERLQRCTRRCGSVGSASRRLREGSPPYYTKFCRSLELSFMYCSNCAVLEYIVTLFFIIIITIMSPCHL